ncbi:hypothetical protein C8Q79DRAFT_496480 [Trametes meyenii]|nr:hypothetical protein C8Q79DRAFT_496480 [Trametes meyenii]
MSLPTYQPDYAVSSQVDLPRLPVYSQATETLWDVPPTVQEHRYHLTAKKTGAQWLVLTMKSRATSPTEAPTFYQGANIAGNLSMQLDKEESIDEVTLSLYGRLSIFSHSTSNFFYSSKTLYSAAERSLETDSPVSFLKRGRLKGSYEWSFSFRLPKGVSILSSIAIHGDASERENYHLPPSFSDDQANVHVQYSLVARVSRGGFKAGSKLTIPLAYIPLARPTPPSILRQLAYQESHPLVGPDGDPDGWKALAPVTVKGILFKTVPVEAECRISRPLSYTRGGPIHLLISIKCNNKQLYDLLTTQSVHFSLLQRITFGEALQRTRFSERLAPQITIKTLERAVASWWRDLSAGECGSTKTFAGELLVPNDLTPACRILHYGHEYELAFYGLSAVGFMQNPLPKKPLLTEPVGVVTAFAQAPRPRSYVPPEYDGI